MFAKDSTGVCVSPEPRARGLHAPSNTKRSDLSPKLFIVALIGLFAANVGLIAAICAMTLGQMAAFGVIGTAFGAAVTTILVATAIWQVLKQ